ncbi:hypothetical protein VUJ46_08495 [Chryseobacterium sp. MYb264]|uniref:hypothetical protein n=1 Tax=Chryseobacterium sp. MYb264 TaxID=2745153 RepID=UPI002E1512CF|nr:hypothetical protein VUJ46_08495 [Chryseobacterium sp. MYb264]
MSLLSMIGCKDNVKNKPNISEPTIEDIVIENSKGADEAKKWLEKSIVDYFKADISEQEKIMKAITTKDYYEFKTDATNVDMDVDGSLTRKEFDQKWGDKYDINFAGINTGFLISAQDWINIEIRKCEVTTVLNNVYTFKVILADDGFEAKYFRDIKVIKEEGKFLIDGVIESN